MQLRHNSSLTDEEYVTRQAWREASLSRCPRHPEGGCGLSRHGTYARVKPPGMRVARFYCAAGQQTFSLLPDCMAARMGGSLTHIEERLVAVESIGFEATVRWLRVAEVELAGARRWLERRRRGVAAAMLALATALPGCLGPVHEVSAVRRGLATEQAQMALRQIGADHLQHLPAPIGFTPWGAWGSERDRGLQQDPGLRPP